MKLRLDTTTSPQGSVVVARPASARGLVAPRAVALPVPPPGPTATATSLSSASPRHATTAAGRVELMAGYACATSIPAVAVNGWFGHKPATRRLEDPAP